MKKTFFLLFLVAALIVSSMAVFAAPAKIKIGFLVKQAEELWFQNEWKFAQKFADEKNVELIKIGVPDGEKVMAAIDNLAAQKAQGFVICTPDVRLGPAIMAKANAKKLKVFTVDDRFVGADGKPMAGVPYMGISSAKIGFDIGQALYAEMKKRGWNIAETAAMAVTHDELETIKQRTDGSKDALVKAGFPAGKIYDAVNKTLDVPGAMEGGNVALIQHPEVKRWLVFGGNEECVIGAIRAMEGRNFNGTTIIGIGLGASIGISEFKKPGMNGFFATSAISPYRHGYETTKLLYEWIKSGKKPPVVTLTAGYIVTRETYKKVMTDLGLVDSITN